MNIAIVFAKGPEEGKRNINLYLINGKPLIYYSIKAALESKKTGKIYVATDSKDIADIAHGLMCEVIQRPAEIEKKGLGGAIIYASKKISGKTDFSNLIILSGNTVMVSAYLIDKSVEILEKNEKIKSVLTVWKARHDHPVFAISKENRIIKPFSTMENSGNVYFHDGCVCTFRKEILKTKCFPDPRWWMKLPDCSFIVRPWPTGRDVHDSYDLSLARWWIENQIIDIAEEEQS